MKRLIYKELVAWKNKKNRKPLILDGARQVGKTWILKEFGKHEYSNVAYINCDNNPQMDVLFSDFNTERLIRSFSAIANQKIEPEKTLIILDEVQEVPLAITSLKYFCEEAPQYHIVVAGSLLGVKVHRGTGFPVGKIDTLRLYPLSFDEFLLAKGMDILLDTIRDDSFENLNAFQSQLIDLLRQYYFVGGMPSVVSSYIENNDLSEVRELQRKIIEDYEMDFSKHIPERELSRVISVWNSIPSQLAKENKKFVYGAIKTGARAKDYESAIEWLISAGLIYKVERVKKIEKPLKFYEDINGFKLFVSDLGLLGAMVDASAKDVLIGNNVFSSYKGSFTEQYVAQQFFSIINKKLFYYTNGNSTMEIDFIFEGDVVYPIEVKAEINLKAKSLSTVLKENEELFGIRFSMASYIEQERLKNIPLPLVFKFFRETILY